MLRFFIAQFPLVHVDSIVKSKQRLIRQPEKHILICGINLFVGPNEDYSLCRHSFNRLPILRSCCIKTTATAHAGQPPIDRIAVLKNSDSLEIIKGETDVDSDIQHCSGSVPMSILLFIHY